MLVLSVSCSRPSYDWMPIPSFRSVDATMVLRFGVPSVMLNSVSVILRTVVSYRGIHRASVHLGGK
eukprot:939459-Pyramimonas_sp.AAC.1